VHAVRKLRSVATDVAGSVVCVGRTDVLCKDG